MTPTPPARPENAPAVRLRGLTRAFGEHVVLDDLDDQGVGQEAHHARLLDPADRLDPRAHRIQIKADQRLAGVEAQRLTDGRLGLVTSPVTMRQEGENWCAQPDDRLHVVDLARTYADRVVGLHQGRVVFDARRNSSRNGLIAAIPRAPSGYPKAYSTTTESASIGGILMTRSSNAQVRHVQQ